jgi:myosin heavy subunit
MITCLQQQILEKNERKKEEEEIKDLHAQILKADTGEFEESEKRRRELRKTIYRKYGEQLRDQIRSIRSIKADEDGSMNADEIKMNRDLIEIVEKVLREESDVCSNGNSKAC